MRHLHLPSLRFILGLATSVLSTTAAFAQGALTPPGAPALTMKTLDQIEARKPLGTPNAVTTSTIVINEPGSYVLVGPITVASGNGITINESNVTLDLNGFTLSSTAATDDGSAAIKINGDGTNVTNVSIRNGFIFGAYTVASDGTGSGSGFTHGIRCHLTNASNVSVSQISVRGVKNSGILLFNGVDGYFGKITGCDASHVGAEGISAANVEQCTVVDIATGPLGYVTQGIAGQNVANCTVTAFNAQIGISAYTVTNSTAAAKGYGILASAVSNCTGTAVDLADLCVGISAGIVTNSTGAGRIGISAERAVTNSRGSIWASSPGDLIGIDCRDGTVSFSSGHAPAGGNNRAIIAKIAVACTALGHAAPIQSPSLQLGTVGIP